MRRSSPFSILSSAALTLNRIITSTVQHSTVEHIASTGSIAVPHPAKARLTAGQWAQPLFEIYCCASFFVYSAAFLSFFWEFASLLKRFSVFDIVGFLSYQLMFALFESLLVAGWIFLLVRAIPFRWVRAHQSVVGALFILAFAASSLIFREKSGITLELYSTSAFSYQYGTQIVMFLWLFAALGISMLGVLIAKKERIVAQIHTVLENLSVLAGLYTALSLVGIMVVLYRNLP